MSSGRAEAQRLVETIGQDNGYVPEAMLDEMSQNTREWMVQTLENLRRLAASSAKTYVREYRACVPLKKSDGC